MITFVAGILIALGVVSPSYKVGTQAWCTVSHTTGTVECNYVTRAECETYRQSDEYCEKNPEPGKKY